MTTTTITAADAGGGGLVSTAGNDGTLTLQAGPAGGKVNAVVLDATGNMTVLGAVSQTVLNATALGSDATLAIGQLAYVDVSAATTAALHIATGDNQEYEIRLSMQGNTGNTGNVILNPNNNTFANFFRSDGVIESGGASSFFSTFHNGFLIAYDQDPRRAVAQISTKTISKGVLSNAAGYTGTTMYYSAGSSIWQASASSVGAGDTTTAWTSLGTITFPVAATGRIYIRRLA